MTAGTSCDWLGQLPPDIHAEAFRRRDLYGTYCNNTLSLPAKLRLIIVSATLVPLKLLACIFCVVSYYVAVSIGNALLSEPFKTQYMAFWGRFWTRAVLYCLGFWYIKWIYVNPDGSLSSKAPAGLKSRKFGGYVSNHCSWVDIVLYMSRIFPSFVAKKEVSNLALVGPISKAMQCLFVDREARLAGSDANGDGGGQGMSQLVKERMQRKYAGDSELPMMLFPEGTTTNNRFLMPFKRGAFVAGVPVQPLVLKYDTSGRFSPTWDAMPGHHHIFLTMTELALRVTVYVLPLYEPSPEEKADPALYAENVRQMMVKYSKIPPCSETFADKLAFFKYVVARMRKQKSGSGEAEAGAAVKVNGAKAEAKASNGVGYQGLGSNGGPNGVVKAQVDVQARAEVQAVRQRKEGSG